MSDALSSSPLPGIAQLLNESRFKVPSHQRDYSWDEDEIQTLLDDVRRAITKSEETYFLGLLVFLAGQPLTILDGQQRLATTLIIFSAIRDWLTSVERHDDARKIQERFLGASELGEENPEPRLTLNLANNNWFLEYVVKPTPLDEVATHLKKLKRSDPNRPLLAAILFTHKAVRALAGTFSNEQDAAKHLFQIVTYLRDKAGVVRLIVNSESAAYTIFETLNDRGVDLSPLDLVKNFLFGRAAELSDASLQDIQQRWVQMMQTLATTKARAFLKTFWTSRFGRIRTNMVFEKFRTQYQDKRKAVDLSIELLVAAEQYAALDSPDDVVWSGFSKEAKAHVANLKLLGNQSLHPVMMSALTKMTVAETQKLLWLLEVTLVRFLLVGGGNPGKLEPVCAQLAEMIFTEQVTNVRQAFAELREVYPNDDEFEAAFRIKSERTSPKAKYFLSAIEKEMQFQIDGSMANEQQFDDLTVEHILPKKPGPDWEKTLKADRDLIDDCTMRLGNLTLLTGVNRQLANLGFEKKKVTFAISKIAITKEIATYKEWNRASIDARQAAMAKHARTIWRFK